MVKLYIYLAYHTRVQIVALVTNACEMTVLHSMDV